MHQQQQEPQFQHSSYATSFHSEFDHFIQSQIASLIVEERARDPNLNREQELGIAIEFCKRFLLDGENGSQQDAEKQQSLPIGDEQQRKAEVLAKLVELKLELEQHKEFLEKSADSAADLVKGHEFALQPATGKNAYCESCLGTIWRLIQRWRRCQVCGFRVHDKCMDKVRRMCVSMKLASPGFGLLFQLCPEQSLRDQDYQCAECSAPISYDDQSDKQPRLCDYTGSLYCRRCHWNDEMVIPARLVRNWDIEKRPVCRATKQLLTVIARRPLIDLPRENPLLFKFVHSLNKMQRLRSNIMFMKCYFVSCKIARKLRILQHLNRFQYFVESDSLYSMEDLTELAAGRLLPEIDSIVHIFRRHITQECEICRGNAFFCELCSSNERIYPFTDNVAICKSCTAVYHRPCFDQASKRCPRCARRRSRRRALFVQEGDDITE